MFKKIWNLVKRHKLLTIICSTAIILTVVMIVIFFSFFVSSRDKYGNRLYGIEKVELTSKDKKNIIEELEDNKEVKKATVRIQGKIIYINIKYNENTDLNSAKKIAEASVDELDEKQLKFYDLGYFLTSDGEKGFNITGTKNAKLEKISWIKS